MAIRIEATREGPVFHVRAQPGAPRTAVRGEHAGAVKVAVHAPPERGRANEELVRFLAGALGVGRRSLEVVSGETSRAKRVLVRGLDGALLAARLAELVREGA